MPQMCMHSDPMNCAVLIWGWNIFLFIHPVLHRSMVCSASLDSLLQRRAPLHTHPQCLPAPPQDLISPGSVFTYFPSCVWWECVQCSHTIQFAFSFSLVRLLTVHVAYSRSLRGTAAPGKACFPGACVQLVTDFPCLMNAVGRRICKFGPSHPDPISFWAPGSGTFVCQEVEKLMNLTSAFYLDLRPQYFTYAVFSFPFNYNLFFCQATWLSYRCSQNKRLFKEYFYSDY